jgi:hypothetical protein
MRIYILYLMSFILFSCSKKVDSDIKIVEQKAIDTTTVALKDKNDWQNGFTAVDSIDGKPTKFYIENKKCDSLAIAFYYGKYRPSDDGYVSRLLELSATDDKDLRPFYRWVLDKTIDVADGALGEYPGVPARKYAEKFPEEFFKFMDEDATKTRYENWTDIISYSGFYENDDYKNPKAIRKQLEMIMLKNSSPKLKNRIAKFTLDCFPDVNKMDL